MMHWQTLTQNYTSHTKTRAN